MPRAQNIRRYRTKFSRTGDLATGICAPLCYGNVKINSKTTNSQVSCLISNEQLKISDTINYQLWMTLESSIAKQIYDLSLHKNK